MQLNRNPYSYPHPVPADRLPFRVNFGGVQYRPLHPATFPPQSFFGPPIPQNGFFPPGYPSFLDQEQPFQYMNNPPNPPCRFSVYISPMQNGYQVRTPPPCQLPSPHFDPSLQPPQIRTIKVEDKSIQTVLPFHNHNCLCGAENTTKPDHSNLSNGLHEMGDQQSLSNSDGDMDGDHQDSSEPSNQDWAPKLGEGAVGLPPKMRLNKLCAIIQRLFIQGDVIQEDYELLSQFEKRLLYYLVKRKFIPKNLKDLESDDNTCNYEKLKRVYITSNPRRPEECYKFVLTRVLKHLRRQFEAEEGCTNPEQRLNDVYFRPVSDKFGIPMSDFNYPLAGNQKGKFHFNFLYFSKIFKSDAFLQKIFEYTKEDIFVDFQKDLNKKVAALTHKWERILSNDLAFIDYAQMSILRYVIFNKRCKLPWTQVDVTNAIERVKDLIQICAEGKSNVGGHLIRNASRQRIEAMHQN